MDLRIRLMAFCVIIVAAFAGVNSSSWALDPVTLPTGGQVVAGQGNITQSGPKMTVNQQSDRMVANWSTFNIGQNATVQFYQPGAGSVALNRILDQNPSQIFGSLIANGRVFLVNPSGIYFSPTAVVDVGGLVASSLNITNENFLAGRYLFERSGPAGSIFNQGTIRASDGGYVAFLSPRITNEGSVTAGQGTVAMAAADKVELDFVGDNLVTFTVEQGAIDALVENRGLIKADGGMVILTAKAADALTQSVVNNSGVIEAQTLENRAGRILLLSDMEHGETVVGGRLDASAPNGGDGGFIETSGAKVSYQKGFFVTAGAPYGTGGLWLIDPADSDITQEVADGYGDTLSTGTSVLNEVTGDITMYDPSLLDHTVSILKDGGGDATLTFKATGNIILEDGSAITSTAGKLNVILNADSGGVQTGGITIKPDSVINTNGGNIVMGGGDCTAAGCTAPAYGSSAAGAGTAGITLGGAYGTVNLSSGNGSIWMSGYGMAGDAGIRANLTTVNSGASGSVAMTGTGVYDEFAMQDGNGYGILLSSSTVIGGSGGLTLTGTAGDSGLGFVPGALGLIGGSSAYTTNGGLLTVNAHSGLYVFCNFSDDLLGGPSQNGDIALNFTGTAPGVLPNITIPNGNLTVSAEAGLAPGVYTQSISGTTSIDAKGTIADLVTAGSFNTGALTIANAGWGVYVVNDGALTLGDISTGAGQGPIAIATRTGNLTLNGAVSTTNTTENAVVLNAGLAASAGTATGGNILVGSGTITTGDGGRATLYSGSIAGSTGLTALVGSGSGHFRYNSDESATHYTAALGEGKYAVYREQPTLTATANNASKTYNGVAYSGGNGVTVSGNFANGDTDALLGGVPTFGGTSQGAVNVNTYKITPGGYTSGLGYALTFADGTLNVTPAALSVTANAATKSYGQTVTFAGTEFTASGLQNGETIGSVSLASAGAAATAGVSGSPYAITAGAATGGTFAAGNYTITYNNGSLTVTPAALSITANSTSKTYGQTTTFTGTEFSASGLKNGETVGSVSLASAGAAATAPVSGSSYAITAGSATGGTFTAGNYTITYNNGSLTISPAALSITANSTAKTYGQTLAFAGTEFTASGLQNGETVGSVSLASAGAAATAAVSGSPYAITAGSATGGTFTAGNYTITYHNGQLTVDAGPVLPPGPPPPAPPPTVPAEAEAPIAAVTSVLTSIPNPVPTTPGGPGGSPTIDVLASGTGVTVTTPLTSGSSTTAFSGGTGGTGSPAPVGGVPTLTPPGANAFQVVVVAKTPGAPDSLVVNAPVRDSVFSGGSRISVTIPSDAFAATNRNATVTLTATRANGAALPGWMAFNPQTGTFEGTPPPGFRGEVAVRVMARDSQGREAVQVFKIVVGGQGQGGQGQGEGGGQGQGAPGSRPGRQG